MAAYDLNSASPQPAKYKDRSTGLLVFGIVFLLLAGLSAMVGLLSLAAGMSANSTPGQGGAGTTMLGVFLVYGFVAVVLGVLGAGSIRARRWCRPIVLALSAFACVASSLSVVIGAIFASDFAKMFDAEFAKLPQQGVPEGMGYVVLFFMGAFFLFAGVLFPLGIFLFFRSPHVRATCEAKDPDRRWTDACPVPVLALVMMVGVNALFVVLAPFTSKGFFPFFGEYLIGFPGGIACVLMASALFYAAWRTYYLDILGWWIILAVSMLQSVSQVMTMMNADFAELYRMMGYPADMIEQLVESQRMMSGFSTTNTAVFAVVGLVFLVWVKRYFRNGEE